MWFLTDDQGLMLFHMIIVVKRPSPSHKFPNIIYINQDNIQLYHYLQLYSERYDIKKLCKFSPLHWLNVDKNENKNIPLQNLIIIRHLHYIYTQLTRLYRVDLIPYWNCIQIVPITRAVNAILELIHKTHPANCNVMHC